MISWLKLGFLTTRVYIVLMKLLVPSCTLCLICNYVYCSMILQLSRTVCIYFIEIILLYFFPHKYVLLSLVFHLLSIWTLCFGALWSIMHTYMCFVHCGPFTIQSWLICIISMVVWSCNRIIKLIFNPLQCFSRFTHGFVLATTLNN